MNKDINYTLTALVPLLRMNGEKVVSVEAVQDWYKVDGREYMKEVAEITYENGYRHYADIGCDANLTAVYDVIAVIQQLKPRSEKIERIVRGVYDSKGSWIPCSVDLPNEGEWVLAKINDGQPEGPHRDVVRIMKGITEEEREQLRQAGDRRALVYCPGDEDGNNLVPYSWKTFGPAQYFGQEVIEWMPLP